MARAETFARHLGPFVRQLTPAAMPGPGSDATAPLREKLAIAGVVGRSPALAHVLQQVSLVAPLDIDILLTGESGIGKGQLAHVLQAAAIRCAGAGLTQIEPGHLFPDGRGVEVPDAALSLQEATRQFQERFLRQTLDDTGWNVVDAARQLDVSRSTVYNLIRAYNIRRDLG